MPVAWPAAIRREKETELRIVADQKEWDLDPDLSGWPYGENDRLVDSTGREHRLVWVGNGRRGTADPEPTERVLSLLEIAALCESHLMSIGASVLAYRDRVKNEPPHEWTKASFAFLLEEAS